MPWAFQILRTVEWDRPVARAIARVDQGLAPASFSSKVIATNCSIRSSVTLLGAPGRGSLRRPSSSALPGSACPEPHAALAREALYVDDPAHGDGVAAVLGVEPDRVLPAVHRYRNPSIRTTRKEQAA